MGNNHYVVRYEDAELDAICPMKFWHASLAGDGVGMTKKTDIVPNAIENIIHEDLRTISNMMDLSPRTITNHLEDLTSNLTYEDRQQTRFMELFYRRLGWIAAFASYIEPKIRLEYETIPTPEEIDFTIDNISIICKPDRLLRDRKTNELVYQEYLKMPLGLANRGWMDAHKYHMRLHVGMAAMNQLLNEKNGLRVLKGQIRGMSEGYWSSYDKSMHHPYIQGYYSREQKEWNTEHQMGKEWEELPVWQYPDGMVKWVHLVGEKKALQVFPLTEIVDLNLVMLDSWMAYQVYRQRQISKFATVCQTNHHLRQVHFERDTSSCRPYLNPPCTFLNACWNEEDRTQPLKSGEYVLNLYNADGRTP